MSDPLQNARTAFLKNLDYGIWTHGWKRTFDAGMHQFLVIGSAVAGFAALALGLIAKDHPEFALWAGGVGALTSVATILSQQLHCVRAVNWHDRMSVELDIIRDKFLFKFNSAPTDQQLSDLTDEVAKLKLKMVEAWEKITATGPSILGRIRKPTKDST
jgi:uncharacterized protein YihD (DUF1040 family)